MLKTYILVIKHEDHLKLLAATKGVWFHRAFKIKAFKMYKESDVTSIKLDYFDAKSNSTITTSYLVTITKISKINKYYMCECELTSEPKV